MAPVNAPLASTWRFCCPVRRRELSTDRAGRLLGGLSRDNLVGMDEHPATPRASRIDPRRTVLYAIARRQHLLITRRDALDSGFRRDEIDGFLRTGRWQLVIVGVYAPAAVTVDPLLRLRALQLRHDDVVASHETAAALWGLLGHTLQRHLRCVRPRDSRLRIADATVRWRRDVIPVDVVDGVRVTTLARTLADLREVHGPARLRSVYAEACRTSDVTPDDIRAELCDGARHVRTAHAVLDGVHVEVRSKSRAEAEFQALLVDVVGATPPVRNAQVRLSNGQIIEFDLLWPVERLAVEFDGAPFHGLDLDRISDAERDDWAAVDGYEVSRWGNEALRRPDLLIADVRRRLAARAPAPST